jgi:hypothetical protein
MNLWFSPNATHLVPGLKCNLSYVNLYDYDFEFTYGLNAIITSSTSLQDIDSRGIKFAEQFIKQKYETMLERKSRKRGKKDTPRPQDTKTLPVFEDEYMENREFVLQRIGEKNADFLIAYKILGTIPYSAINSYFKFNRKKIVEPGDFSSKSKLDKPFAPIIREFTFEDHPGLNPSAQKRIEMISPFLTQLIMPYVPMLVQESKLVRGSMSTEYGLMIPTEIKYQ